MVTLLARLDASEVDWVGTSMGGLIGLGVAALAGSPLRRLVLNDVGPSIQPQALERIGAYLGQPVSFATLDEAADYLLGISPGFGKHTREQWLALCRPMLVEQGDRLVLHYDPAIAGRFRGITPELAAAIEAALWKAYDTLTLPTLLLRGADSDVLSHATAEAMTRRGPKAKLVEFASIGHAPMLTAADQIQVVREFLLSSP
jgi:pimeloyl-ACP methyl ester carboxylesterase